MGPRGKAAEMEFCFQSAAERGGFRIGISLSGASSWSGELLEIENLGGDRLRRLLRVSKSHAWGLE